MLSIGAIMPVILFVPALYRPNALSAEVPLLITPIAIGSIAAMPAISLHVITGVGIMTKDQLQREINYQATMCCVAQMRNTGIITDTEYEKCREMMLQKYDPPFGKIVSNRAISY